MKEFFLVCLVVLGVKIVTAQKRPINSTVFDKWPIVSEPVAISRDGEHIFYTIASRRKLVIQSTDNKWKAEAVDAHEPAFFDDGRKLIFIVGHDSLCIFNLKDKSRKYLGDVQAYRLFSCRGQDCIALTKKEGSLELLDVNFISIKSFKQVNDYSFSEDGSNLLMQILEEKEDHKIAAVKWFNILTGQNKVIWQSDKPFEISSLSFDYAGMQAAFVMSAQENGVYRSSIWYCNNEMSVAEEKVNSVVGGMPEGCTIYDFDFSQDNEYLLIKMKKKKVQSSKKNNADVDVWSYADDKLQSQQLQELEDPWLYYKASFNIRSNRLIILMQENEMLFEKLNHQSDTLWLITKTPCYYAESNWRSSCRVPLYLVNTKDGNRKLVKPNMLYSDRSGLSPDEKYVLFYDYDEKAYFSYNINIGKTINITKDIPFPIYGQTPAGTTLPHPYSSLPDTWFHNGKSLIVYDQYDLWKIDPTGKELPFCLTQGYGRKNEIIFRLPPDTKFSKTNVLLTAFRTSDKSSGFYRMDLSKKSSPELLSMQPCSYAWGDIESMNDTWQPLKAENSNTYLLLKRTASEAPNFVITNDFKHFRQLSDVQPQKNYNWLTAELHTWQDCNGERLQGILYKPENFDSQKRYPVIFNFYEEKSFGLYNYLIPKATGDHINIPHFVSNDYLVFVPDITYKKGDPAKSVCDAIVSATNYISKMPFVDSSKFGLQGHSFAGYEVNVLVSKTFRFAAAAEAAGTSDLVSAYNSLKGASFSNQFAGETGQYRIGATLWQNRDAYIKNSPIFYADQVQTPLLMQNNKKDYTVKFEQGVEFFTALRRLNKKVWMLQYDGQSHQMDGSSAKDYTVRLMQFFDHYLKSAPAPIWMTQGVPARLKGVITGYDLDPSGNCGKDCKVCKMWNEKMKKDSAGTMNEIREKAKSEHWMDGGGN